MKQKIGIFLPHKHSLPLFFLQTLDYLSVQKYIDSTYISYFHKHQQSRVAVPLAISFLFYLGYLGKYLAVLLMRKKMQNFDTLIVPFSMAKYFQKDCKLIVYASPKTEQAIKKIANLKLSKQLSLVSEVAIHEEQKDFFYKFNFSFDYVADLFPTSEDSIVKLSDQTYFFSIISSDMHAGDVIYLLRSFSKFKKHHKSSMKLLLYTEDDMLAQKIKLDTYYYKADVKLTKNFDKHTLQNAYALLYLNDQQRQFHIPAISTAISLKCPVITVDNLFTRSLGHECVLYFDRQSTSSFADKMKQLFADESFRAALIQRGVDYDKQNKIYSSYKLFYKKIL